MKAARNLGNSIAFTIDFTLIYLMNILAARAVQKYFLLDMLVSNNF